MRHSTLVVVAAFAIAASSSGCQRDAARTTGDSATAAPAASAAAPAASSFAARLDAGPCEHGKPCVVTAVVEPRGVYHVNPDYPAKWKPDETAGVAWAKPVFTRADGSFDERRGALPGTFTPSAAGPLTIAGTFSFSVCESATMCVIEHAPVSTVVQVR